MKDISDIQTATHCLHQLLGVLYEAANELDAAPGDAIAVRLTSLLILARDEAERIDDAIGQHLTSRVNEVQADLAVIQTLGEEYDEALRAWIKASEAADTPNATTMLKDLEQDAEQHYDMYRDALFNFKSPHPVAMAEKATILLRVWNGGDGITDERIVQLLQSMGGRA